ncbi:hypothetical protein BAUCODRAFT_119405 [Baudoinia panamericana UAMH 10762]|uniref:Uncharacterized protein n=1 Tax=Baudoinia panamericana (strain UAMH 10762) TaxID=717646 RepID=M2NK72_BAUPA|nr:uncharacterized protein BAUCODRAFT_119405 [Baudoinia panamericana UAMH 10762]EMC99834.1 hypothetical protein BAUCODRAFT_119405 [Baudoinia panamericana UAMH 10762]
MKVHLYQLSNHRRPFKAGARCAADNLKMLMHGMWSDARKGTNFALVSDSNNIDPKHRGHHDDIEVARVPV